MLRRWAALPPVIRWLAGTAAVVLALAFAWALFVPVADALAHHDVGSVTGTLHETALDNARGRLLTLGAGLVALVAVGFTARTFYLSREGQVTDRYGKATEQLGSDKLDVRIGGIYALERVARDSARDHPTVMEVLTAFIREHSHEQWPPPGLAEPGEPRPRPDVQAAVTVVGRRNAARDRRPVDLTGAGLAGADLAGAHLAGADLYGADLTHAILTDEANLSAADLNYADLSGANLHHANLSAAKLSEANLIRADLRGADVRGADLGGADLSGAILAGDRVRANLAGAFLNGANLSGADLTLADLSGARLRNANLIGADLTRANLAGADLADADLAGVVIDVTDLTRVRWPEGTPVPEGWKRDAGTGRLRWAGD